MCAKFLNSNYLSVTFSLKSVKQHKQKKILHSDVILTKHPHIHFILPSVSKVVVEMNIFLFNKLFFFSYLSLSSFPCSSVGKESACSAGDRVRSLGWEDPLEKEMATHSSILAWKISWTEEPGGLKSMGLQRVRHDWATNTYLLTG